MKNWQMKQKRMNKTRAWGRGREVLTPFCSFYPENPWKFWFEQTNGVQEYLIIWLYWKILTAVWFAQRYLYTWHARTAIVLSTCLLHSYFCSLDCAILTEQVKCLNRSNVKIQRFHDTDNMISLEFELFYKMTNSYDKNVQL